MDQDICNDHKYASCDQAAEGVEILLAMPAQWNAFAFHAKDIFQANIVVNSMFWLGQS